MHNVSVTRPRAASLVIVILASALLIAAGPTGVLADSAVITFEPPTYSIGDINGQDGWSKTGPYDAAVVADTGVPGFGDQSLRISNAFTSGSFGDQTFSKLLAEEAGETNAYSPAPTTTRYPYFSATWEVASAVPGAEQPGLSVVASPDRGDGGRMSWLQMRDTADGLEINFFDYQDVAPYGSNANPADGVGAGDDFVFTTVASGLDRSVAHSIGLEMFLVDGPRNDVVNVYVDGALAHTGTSWEDYFRWNQGPGDPEETAPVRESRTIRSILFRTAGTAAPATLGNGFFIDNLELQSGPAYPVPSLAPCAGVVDGTTYRLTADCTTDHTLLIPDGWTLDGDGYTITAVDPAGDHFRGAVVQNAGASAHVVNLTVTSDSLANVCDGGADRLRGILFDGAGGSITDSVVTDVNQGPSGCQEGNAIELRNEPFDDTGTDVEVLIDGNVADGYIKNGITANGSVAAIITNNVVTGSGPVGVPLAAQNGIQVGYGATARVSGNTVSGNDYTPKDWVSCGLLLYQADGVRASGNTYFDNERDVCNFGKGGGRFNPNS